MGREVVPERWQSGANPDHLADLLERYILEPEYRERVYQDLVSLKSMLGERGATERVAQSLNEFLGAQ